MRAAQVVPIIFSMFKIPLASAVNELIRFTDQNNPEILNSQAVRNTSAIVFKSFYKSEAKGRRYSLMVG